MDEKKVREAIEDLKGIAFKCEGILESLPSKEIERSAYKNIPQSIYIAIEALERQLPRKGIKEKITEGSAKGLHKFYCPICYEKGDLSNKCNVGEYCSDCGQRLDWSE